jgi:regulatory protein
VASVTVTGLSKRPRSKLLDVSFDGAPDLKITPDVAVVFGLRPGAELSQERLEELRAAQAREDTMAAAFRLVSYRPRSEKELRDRLRRRGFPEANVTAAVDRMKELRLVDDAAFAASWVESRDRTGPRSRRLLSSELRSKGVSGAIANDASSVVDEPEAAYRAASRRAANLAGRPFEDFRRKVGEYLLRRGFSYEIAESTVTRLWQESASVDAVASG